MAYHLLWIIPLALGGFAAFWCLIVKLIAQFGWARLAAAYQVTEAALPPTHTLYPQRVQIGSASYKGVLRVRILPAGLGLWVAWPFRVGHPPLLVPWAAIGPVQVEKQLWARYYRTQLRLPGTGQVSLSFTDERLAAALSRQPDHPGGFEPVNSY